MRGCLTELFQIRSHNGNDTPGAVMNMKNLHKLPLCTLKPHIYWSVGVCSPDTRKKRCNEFLCCWDNAVIESTTWWKDRLFITATQSTLNCVSILSFQYSSHQNYYYYCWIFSANLHTSGIIYYYIYTTKIFFRRSFFLYSPCHYMRA